MFLDGVGADEGEKAEIDKRGKVWYTGGNSWGSSLRQGRGTINILVLVPDTGTWYCLKKRDPWTAGESLCPWVFLLVSPT